MGEINHLDVEAGAGKWGGNFGAPASHSFYFSQLHNAIAPPQPILCMDGNFQEPQVLLTRLVCIEL